MKHFDETAWNLKAEEATAIEISQLVTLVFLWVEKKKLSALDRSHPIPPPCGGGAMIRHYKDFKIRVVP